MKNSLFILLFTLIPLLCFSQFNNSQKQTVLNLQNGSFKFFKLTGGETSFETNFRKREIYADDEEQIGDSLVYNLSYLRNSAFNLKAGITNIGKFVDLKDLDFEDKGFLVRLSYVSSFKQLVVREREGKYYIPTSFSLDPYSFGFQIEMDNFDRYDPVDNKIKDSKPITLSLIGSWTHIYFGEDRKINALTFNGQIDALTYDESEFTSNFKRLGSITNINDEIGTFDDFDGKFGRLENNAQRYLLTISYSFLSPSDPKEDAKLFITPIPYISVETISGGKVFNSIINGKPKATFGIIGGFSTKSVFSKVEEYGDEKDEKPITLNMLDGKKVIYNNYKYRSFAQPSFIYIGIDNTMRDGVKPDLNFFLAGSFSFD